MYVTAAPEGPVASTIVRPGTVRTGRAVSLGASLTTKASNSPEIEPGNTPYVCPATYTPAGGTLLPGVPGGNACADAGTARHKAPAEMPAEEGSLWLTLVRWIYRVR